MSEPGESAWKEKACKRMYTKCGRRMLRVVAARNEQRKKRASQGERKKKTHQISTVQLSEHSPPGLRRSE